LTKEEISSSPIAILLTVIFGSSAGGVGSNYLLSEYKIDQLKKDFQTNVSEIKEIRKTIKALIQMQNECMTSAKILEYRLNNTKGE